MGACVEGVPIYSDEETCALEDCVGDVGGVSEICNGIDDDCDGVVDEVYATIDRRKDACSTLKGECSKSHVYCDGRNGWVCDKPSTYENPEVSCDNIDNNCDGAIDNIAISELTFCYDFDPATLVTQAGSECRPGYMDCVAGAQKCISQHGPQHEYECDGKDNDCDGQVDEKNPDQLDNFQIVFGVDYSGSMSGYIENLIFSLDNFVSQFAYPQYQFALVNIAANTPSHLVVLADFGPFSALISTLEPGLDGSSEASIDAIHAVCGETIIQFDPTAHKIYVGFTDEPGQTYTAPPQTIFNGGDECFENGVVAYMFSLNPYEWEDATDPSGGQSFYLSSDHRSMLDDLNTIVQEINCSTNDLSP